MAVIRGGRFIDEGSAKFGDVLRLQGKKFRRCPVCDAAPGHSCRKWMVSKAVRDVPEFARWVVLRKFHRAR